MNTDFLTPEEEMNFSSTGKQAGFDAADTVDPENTGQETEGDHITETAASGDLGDSGYSAEPGEEQEGAPGEMFHPPDDSGKDVQSGDFADSEAVLSPEEDPPTDSPDLSGEDGVAVAPSGKKTSSRSKSTKAKASSKRTTIKEKGEQADEGQASGPDGEGESEEPVREEVAEGPDPVQSESDIAVPEAEVSQPDAAPEAVPRRPVRRRQRSSGRNGHVVLDASGDAIQGSGDAMDEDYYMLQSARNSRSILSGPITAYETSPGGSPIVVSAVGAYKVIIPIKEMGIAKRPNEPNDETAMNYRYRRLIDSMLGATIDFVIKGVDFESQLAGASRAEALAYKRRHILNGTDRDGNFRVYEGLQCMARVISVGDRFARVEIFGHEQTLGRQEITHRWVEDIKEILHPGDERKVVITRLERDPKTGDVMVLRASMADAEAVVDLARQLNIKVGNVYMGRITNIHRNCYFVRSGDLGIDVLCPAAMSYTPTMPKINDTVKFVVRTVNDGKVTGSITRIQRKGGGTRG